MKRRPNTQFGDMWVNRLSPRRVHASAFYKTRNRDIVCRPNAECSDRRSNRVLFFFFSAYPSSLYLPLHFLFTLDWGEIHGTARTTSVYERAMGIVTTARNLMRIGSIPYVYVHVYVLYMRVYASERMRAVVY